MRLHDETTSLHPHPSVAEPGFWTLLREDYVAHDRDWTRPGFQAVAVHRFGVFRMRVRPKLARAPLSVLYRMLFRAVRNFYGIELPYSVQLGRRVVFEHQHGIVVHGDTVIGDDCIVRQGVTLGIRRMDGLDQAPVIGNSVNIGAGAKILGHVTVGDGAAIGANAVVLDDVPAGALVTGIPAKVTSRGPRAVVTPLHPSHPAPPAPHNPRTNGGGNGSPAAE
jgi:serine O-acetyltransferase